MRNFVGILRQIFGGKRQRARLDPLYRAIVDHARRRAWYVEGGVPDTVDGRFDMIAAILALVLLRLEADGNKARRESVLLTETFIDDMDGSIRQMGIGDLMVGKHVGRMVGALGGRLSAFRDALAAGTGFSGPVRRNIFHESPPSEAALDFVARGLEDFHRGLAALPADSLLAGRIR